MLRHAGHFFNIIGDFISYRIKKNNDAYSRVAKLPRPVRSVRFRTHFLPFNPVVQQYGDLQSHKQNDADNHCYDGN